ncbi:Uncharacterised protein [Chlamydia trachomatis]|nr:Uncharacterised protein [Chlamydia trachomatis]
MFVHVGDLTVTGNRIVCGTHFVAGNLVALINSGGALIGQRNTQTLVQEGHLLEALTQGLEGEFGGFEDIRIRVERLRCARLSGFFATFKLRNRRTAVGKGHPPRIALTTNDRVNASRQRVHNRNTDAVKTAGHRISATAEFTAGVQDGHDDLNRGLTFGRVNINGNTSTIVFDTKATIGKNCYFDVIRISS